MGATNLTGTVDQRGLDSSGTRHPLQVQPCPVTPAAGAQASPLPVLFCWTKSQGSFYPSELVPHLEVLMPQWA